MEGHLKNGFLVGDKRRCVGDDVASNHLCGWAHGVRCTKHGAFGGSSMSSAVGERWWYSLLRKIKRGIFSDSKASALLSAWFRRVGYPRLAGC